MLREVRRGLGVALQCRFPLVEEALRLVEGDGGWQQYFVSTGKGLQKRVRREPLTHLMSVLGVTGKTAYCGLLDIGNPQPGETVLVSAAAGATVGTPSHPSGNTWQFPVS